MKHKLLILLNLFWLVSIAYFLFGRYDWSVNEQSATLYAITAFALFNLGYFISTKVKYRKKTIKGKKINLTMIFYSSSILLIVFQIMWVTLFLGSFSISDLLTSIGQRYYERLSLTFDDSVWYMQLRTIAWGLTLFAAPTGILIFKKLSIFGKSTLFFVLIIDVLASLNMGISKPIGDLFILLLLYIAVGETSKDNSIKIKRFFSKFAIISISTLAVALLFTLNLNSRGAASQYIVNPFYRFADIRDNIIFDYFTFNSPSLVELVDRLGGYISHGYAGLAYALEVPFQNTYGIGFSRALTEYFNQYLNIDVSSLTYMQTIQNYFSWPNGMYWPTGFVWLASAFTFSGTLLIMVIFGYIFNRVIISYKLNKDVFSFVLLWQLTIGAFYLPANMQLFQSRTSFFGIITVLVIYLLTRKLDYDN